MVPVTWSTVGEASTAPKIPDDQRSEAGPGAEATIGHNKAPITYNLGTTKIQFGVNNNVPRAHADRHATTAQRGGARAIRHCVNGGNGGGGGPERRKVVPVDVEVIAPVHVIASSTLSAAITTVTVPLSGPYDTSWSQYHMFSTKQHPITMSSKYTVSG